jgi:hypothetical protein
MDYVRHRRSRRPGTMEALGQIDRRAPIRRTHQIARKQITWHTILIAAE